MQKIVLVVIGAVVIAGGAWYFTSSEISFNRESDETGDVVAVVNGEDVLRADFEALKSQTAEQQGFDAASLDAESQSQLDSQIVEELITQTLLRQAVDESGITVSQEEVDTQVEATIAQLGGEEVFQQALVAQGLSEEELQEQIGLELANQSYFEQELNLSSVSATDEEIEAAYAQEKAQNETVPALEDVRDQVEDFVIQQKQQALFDQLVQQLRAEADIEILI